MHANPAEALEPYVHPAISPTRIWVVAPMSPERL
jgi:hypothetical protein